MRRLVRLGRHPRGIRLEFLNRRARILGSVKATNRPRCPRRSRLNPAPLDSFSASSLGSRSVSDGSRWHQRAAPGAVIVYILFTLAACAPSHNPGNLDPTPGCRRTVTPDGSVPGTVVAFRHSGTSTREQRTLDAWCRGVGPALWAPAGLPQPADRLESLVVISWNMGVGCGDLENLIRDLRVERILPEADSPYVVVAQEVFRKGMGVPSDSELSSLNEVNGAGHIRKCEPKPIDQVAQTMGLHMVYVPSMRNGPPESIQEEDRGNAILSTLPLHEVVAIEPPVIAQRRVSVSAVVQLGPGESGPGLRLVSVHLDVSGGGWSQLKLMYGVGGRLRQARAIIENGSDNDTVVVAGDFNTWAGQEEPVLHYLRRRFGESQPHRGGPTVTTFLTGLFSLELDHMFARLPEGWRFKYEIRTDPLGSDHRPLVGVLSIR